MFRPRLETILEEQFWRCWQRDQMTRLFDQNLAISSNDNLPKSNKISRSGSVIISYESSRWVHSKGLFLRCAGWSPLIANSSRGFIFFLPLLDSDTLIDQLKVKIVHLEKQRDEELGGRLNELEDELKDSEKSNLKAETNLKAEKDLKKQNEKKVTQIQKGMSTVSWTLNEWSILENFLCSKNIKMRRKQN